MWTLSFLIRTGLFLSAFNPWRHGERDIMLYANHTMLTPTDSDSHMAFAYIISQCLRLPINHVSDSAYLHSCVLFIEISDWRLSQGSICNETTTVLVIVGALGMIKERIDKHMNKIPAHMKYKKLHFAELLITLEEYNQCD